MQFVSPQVFRELTPLSLRVDNALQVGLDHSPVQRTTVADPTLLRRCAPGLTVASVALYFCNWMVTLRRNQHEAVFRAIADPTRRQILSLLRGRAYSVNEIAKNFRTSRPAISRHLRLLHAVGLVVSNRRGTARICQLNPEPLRVVDAWLRDYQDLWRESLQGLKRYVEGER